MKQQSRWPKYTHGFMDRHGKPRFYLRRPGFQKIAMPGMPWTPEFMAAYEKAMAVKAPMIGAERTKPGSMKALAVSYYQSKEFKELETVTQTVYRNIIERLLKQEDKNGGTIADKSAAGMKKEHVEKLMADKADQPDSANGLRKVLRNMFKHAVETKVRSDDPTQGVKKIKPKKMGGYHSWDEDELAQYEATHPIGSKARLAYALALYTGQARQDVARMGPQHIRDGVLHWTRGKTEKTTGIEVTIPIHPELQAVIDATPSGHLTFLVTEWGKPFEVAGFGNWFRDQCNRAGLRNCSMHGLRKAASRRLAEAGCSAHEIMAITGHASIKEIIRYTQAASRKTMAKSAMEKINRRTKVANL